MTSWWRHYLWPISGLRYLANRNPSKSLCNCRLRFFQFILVSGFGHVIVTDVSRGQHVTLWWRHNYVINFQTFQLRSIPFDQMTEWQIFLFERSILSQLGRFCARTCLCNNKRRPRKRCRDVQKLLKLNRVYFVPIFMVFILPFVLINFKFLWNYQNSSTQVFVHIQSNATKNREKSINLGQV